MPEMNRRKFLVASAGAGAAGLLAGGAAVFWPELHTASMRNPLPAGSGILVVVTLYGGNDGLSTVIPYADNTYYDLRPDLAYMPQDVLPLDGQLGFSPAWKGLAGAWSEQRLAIVRGVSYPKPDQSHFRSMDIWQTGSPTEPTYSGWIGRWLDATGDDPLRAVSIGAVLPPMAVGERRTAAALSGTESTLPSEVDDILGALGSSGATDTAAMAAVCSSYQINRTVNSTFAPITDSSDPSTAFAATAGGFDSPDERNRLADELNMVARCVKAGVPTRVYMVKLGGFDTHADERGTQEKLLRRVDEAITPFLQEMANDVNGQNVVVMMYSEFGRRVAANASQGTDHGTAGPVLIAGVPVKGGFYGDQPSLTDLADGDLKGTTDFRDIYYELLLKTVGTDPTPSVGSRREIGFL